MRNKVTHPTIRATTQRHCAAKYSAKPSNFLFLTWIRGCVCRYFCSNTSVTWNPTHYAGYMGLGKFHERRNETEQALFQYEKSISLADPKEKAEPLELMALLLGKSGDNVRSLEMFKQLTVVKPKSASVWNGVGNNLWALGQLDAATDAYKQAHEMEPDDRTACHNLVLVLNQIGRAAEASLYIECSAEKP